MTGPTHFNHSNLDGPKEIVMMSGLETLSFIGIIVAYFFIVLISGVVGLVASPYFFGKWLWERNSKPMAVGA